MAFIELNSTDTGHPVLFNVDNIIGVVKTDNEVYVKSVNENAVQVTETYEEVAALLKKSTEADLLKTG